MEDEGDVVAVWGLVLEGIGNWLYSGRERGISPPMMVGEAWFGGGRWRITRSFV
jgi:hypothetical protein